MKKLLIILAGFIITNYSIAMVCECPYCGGEQTELTTDIGETQTERWDQIHSYLIRRGLDKDKIVGVCGYLCVVTILYKKGIIKSGSELEKVVDELFEMQLKYDQSIRNPGETYSATITENIIYNTLKNKGFTRIENINFEDLPAKGYSNLEEYVSAKISKSRKSFFVMYSDDHAEPFLPRGLARTNMDRLKTRIDRIQNKFIDSPPLSRIEVWDNIPGL